MTQPAPLAIHSAESAPVDVHALFAEGLALHRQQLLEPAMAIYERVLRQMPNHAGALHHVGLIAFAAGNYNIAAGFIRGALAVIPSSAAWGDLGNAYKELARFDDALGCYDEALVLDARNPDMYYNRATALQALGRFDAALADYDAALALNPNDPEACNNRGVVLKEQGRYEAALASFERAIAMVAGYADAHNNRGNVYIALQRFEEALACYDTVVALGAASGETHFNRARVLQARDDDAALAAYGQAIALDPRLAKAYNNRALVLRRQKRHEEALRDYEMAIGLAPDYQEAHIGAGNVLRDLKRHEDALACYDEALRHGERDAGLLDLRGMTLRELRRYDEALAAHDEALQLDPQLANALQNRGNALRDLHRLDEALACFEQVQQLEPDNPLGWLNQGAIFAAKGRYEEALARYDRAIALDPALAVAYWNRSLLHLEHGNFKDGLADHEWRWQTPHFLNSPDIRPFDAPLWLGREDIAGKSILLYSEQGFGDVLQCARYVPLLAARGATVILETHGPLAGLLARLDGVAQVVPRGQPAPATDWRCPMMSLPLAFGTELMTIPASAHYLRADPAKVEEWREVLGPASKPRVGLVWSGNPTHGNDNNRSLDFARIAALLSDRFEFFTLQRDVRAADQAALDTDGRVRGFGHQLKDFSDTAALCELMDVVVSVDTSVAHLAGALGRPAWVLLPAVADWRWLRERRDSPWYPSARLYRQPSLGAWDAVLAEVKADLERFASGNIFEGGLR
jgi:tetratricopeptide (TPR) repeat protein